MSDYALLFQRRLASLDHLDMRRFISLERCCGVMLSQYNACGDGFDNRSVL